MLTLNLGISMMNVLPAEQGSTAAHCLGSLDFVIACIAAAIAGVVFVALILLIILRHRSGEQAIEDSEAAVRHFLPF